MQGPRHRLAVAAATVAALAPVAHALPVLRYGDAPVSSARGPLEVRLEALVGEVARSSRLVAPRSDARLGAAAAEIGRLAPARGTPPSEQIEAALWLHGLVEPPPHLVIVELVPGGEEELVTELRRQLPRVLAQGSFQRVGVGRVLAGAGERIVVALQESLVTLEPVARALPMGGSAALRGRLDGGLGRAEGFVTAPDGQVRKLAVGSGSRLDGRFDCGAVPGRYQVELAGEDRFGAHVVANFPVYCGMPAPTSVAAARAAAGGGGGQLADPAREVARLANLDRARAGLQALAFDDALAHVAQAHSLDMRAHGFVGHVSPTTGSAADRVRKAGLGALVILENVARAATPAEAERALMNSPGHRANLLDREVTRIGVGVAPSEDGQQILVTQLFTKPPPPFGAHTGDELRAAINAARRAGRVGPLGSEAALDRLAAEAAADLARHDGDERHGSSDDSRRRIEATLGADAHRWRAVRTLFAVVGTPEQAVTSLRAALLDAGMTDMGLGVAPGAATSGQLHVVIVLGARR